MVLNATLNNISVISWGSDFLMEEAGVWIPLRRTLCDKICQWLVAGQCGFLQYSGFLQQ